MPDLSNIFKGTGVELEKKATDLFGASVEDFARSGLSSIGLGSAKTTAAIPAAQSSTWDATSYAAALAGSTDFRPKLKFLFKVEFVFKKEVIDAYPTLASQDFTFMIKTVDRPKIDFEYEEDVNMYNFRTKVLKKIRHRELTVTFMDDVGNRVFNFFRTLMMIHSPITRRQLLRQANDPFSAPVATTATNGSGMFFSELNSTAYEDTAHRGVINSAGSGAAIECIRVKQIFLDPSQSVVRDAPKMVIFDFLNPRLISFDLDDLSHESSDANLLTMQFDYDWMEMVQIDNLLAAPSPEYVAKAPGAQSAPSDILSGGTSTSAPLSSPMSGKGGGNPFVAILTKGITDAAAKVTNEAVNRAVRSVAGNGKLGYIVGKSVGGVLSNAAGGLIGSTVSGFGNSAVESISNGIKQSIVRPAASFISDAATTGGDRPVSIVRASDSTITSNPASPDGST